MQVHRTPNRGEVRLAYAEDIGGGIVHVSRVVSGLACACICPACGKPVAAKQGKKRASHFAHESNGDCTRAVETMLHKLAKQWLAQRGSIAVPELCAHWQGRSRVIFPCGDFNYASVSLEHRMSDVVPDVVLQHGSVSILVEIFVTNSCDETKLRKLRMLGLPAIEIDLSGYFHGMAEEELERAVLQTAPRKWIFHPSLDAAIAELRDEREQEEARKRERERREVERVRKSRQQNTDKARARLRFLQEHASHCRDLQNLGPDAQTPDGREAILDRAVRERLGGRAEEWMWRPCASLEGHTPRIFARASAKQLQQTLCVIGR